MPPKNSIGTIKMVTEPLSDTNFSTWRFKIQNALAYQNLDDFILKDTEEMKKRADYAACKKLTTTFIRMHLNEESIACFVGSNFSTYEPKSIWDAILDFYATKSLENAASLWDKLHDIKFVDGSTQEALNSFRSTFQLLVEVTMGKLDKKTPETCWMFFLLKRLPASFSVFRSIQFANLKHSDISLSTFLKDIESEIRRQTEIQASASFQATALSVTPQSKSKSTPGSRPPCQRCKNGIHDPATAHSEANCHAAPEKAAAFHQASLEKATARIAKKAMLSVNSGVPDTIILDSGATRHYLRHQTYFVKLML
ncbi:hypothetical protein VP01_3133g2 [Puccinia sorghi]|uniref:Retrotransposon Copia-like N-terminal domain-containing protein n=1 Tax=Puccinia sorghi TaxID=27349 RepID=A0A0L6UZV6_9BASI|nr:hypothetical protein VP01_3133g2 [Puccinia sorghi]